MISVIGNGFISRENVVQYVVTWIGHAKFNYFDINSDKTIVVMQIRTVLIIYANCKQPIATYIIKTLTIYFDFVWFFLRNYMLGI